MSVGDAFFDTSIILYLFSADLTKATRAEELLERGGHVSVQVLNELANVGRRKLGLAWPEIVDITTTIQRVCSVSPLTVETHARGLQVAKRYGISVYDSMIVSAALMAGCAVLYTEDMQDGQRIDGQLTLRNPFVPR